MNSKISLVFLILLVVVMLGVVFGVMTNSRNSILVKEIFYVAGGSITSILAAVLLFIGKPFYSDRIPKLSLISVSAILLFMVVRHFTGIESPNGPFTFLMLLSLVALTGSSLMFINQNHIKLFIQIMLGAVSLMFLYAIMQWQGINVFAWDAALTKGGRSTGSLGNPNLLGGFASALIPLGVAYFFSLTKLSKYNKISFVLIFVVLATLTVVASGTRGSLIGVAAGSFVLLFWFVKNNTISLKKVIPFVLFTLVVISAVTIPMSTRLAELDPTVEDQGTLQVRKIIWSGAFQLFKESPVLGHGPGSFQILFPKYRNPFYSILGVSHNTLHAHSEYLEILVDIGLIGLLFWGLAAWGFRSKLKGANLLRAGAFAGLIAMLAEGFVSVHLRWPPTAWLFATLVLIFLGSDSKTIKPEKIHKLAAFVILFVGLILAGGLIVHYLPLSRSSVLVFNGKDVFLANTERAMNSAYSSAAQWSNSGDEGALNAAVIHWQNASLFADSAVFYSREATEAYPYDLGAWYALGSARLTRYMVMEVPVPAMRAALEASGYNVRYTDLQIQNELLAGMAAYDTLITMAPDYAEIHNNFALGYSNLAMLDESMNELYKSYEIHAHRRDDYFNQVSALLKVQPVSISGATLFYHHLLAGFDNSITGIKLQQNQISMFNSIYFLISSQPENEEILVDKFSRLTAEYIPAESQASFIQLITHFNEYSPFEQWHDESIFSMSDFDALESIKNMCVASAFNGSCFPTVLLSNREFYAYPAVLLSQAQWSPEAFDQVMDIFLYQIQIDRNLDDANSLIYSDRFNGTVQQDVEEKVRAVRMAVGGSRAAMRQGYSTPWLSGSLPDLISDSLFVRMNSDSLESIWYQMELRMNFLLVTSYWWDYNIFASSQNQYLLDRIFYNRDMIRLLEPVSWSSIVSRILSEEIDRISLFTDGACPANVSILKDDLVEGQHRVPAP